MKQTITAKNNQSLLDIAIIHTGKVEQAANIAINHDLAVSDTPSKELTICENSILDQKTVDYFKTTYQQPATLEIPAEARQTGIGFMIVEGDFWVR